MSEREDPKLKDVRSGKCADLLTCAGRKPMIRSEDGVETCVLKGHVEIQKASRRLQDLNGYLVLAPGAGGHIQGSRE